LPIASKGWEYSTKINFPTILLNKNKNYFYPPPTKKIFFANIFAHSHKLANIFAHLRNYETLSQTFSQLYGENIYKKSATQLLKNKFPNHANIFANIANTFAALRTFAKSCKHLASPVDTSQRQNKNLSKLRDWGTSLKNEEM
jgi:hypothetical protein